MADDFNELGDGKPRGLASEHDSPGLGVIRLRGLASGNGADGGDIVVGRAGFNNHSLSFGGHNVAWVESDAGDTSGSGRVMLQGLPAGLSAANDNPVWASDHHGAGIVGSEPAIADLMSGDTLLTWVGTDGHVHGLLRPSPGLSAGNGADAPEYAAVNASLADMGPVVATPESGRRLQVTEPRPGSFAIMWLALADSGMVLRGSLFTTPLPAPDEAAPTGHWSATPVADVRLPAAFTGDFAVAGPGDGSADVVVTYSQGGSSDSSVALARRIDASTGQAGPEMLAATSAAENTGHRSMHVSGDARTHHDAPAHEVVASHSHTPGDDMHGAAAQSVHSASTLLAPIVREMQSGFAVVWQSPGASAGTVAIKLSMFEADGSARIMPDGSTVILVADNAAANVAPAIIGTGDGAAVGYVDASPGSLLVKVYEGSGSQVGETVVVDSGESGGISELALGYRHDEHHEQQDELAVVYVRDDHDDQPDYGSIMLQRYGVPSPEAASRTLVALGGDGVHDGNDAPVQLTSNYDGDPTTREAAEGRAPSVAELDNGDLAVVWVENNGTRETISGCVIEADGDQVLRIDLTTLLPDGGIAHGTKPTLLATADGDIVVTWLQTDGDHGYVVMAALYEAAGTAAWIAPDETIRLRAFDEVPNDFAVTLSEQDGIALDVFWRKDSSGSGSGGDILSQRFDIDGNDIGRIKTVADADHGALPADTASAAGLLDGQIVVVYMEEAANGGVDVTAHVIEASTDKAELQSVVPAMEAHSGSTEAVYSTTVDHEIAIDPGAGGVTHVNGVPIAENAPVDVGFGWVQLREDGQLTISPDEHYAGEIEFDFTAFSPTNGSDVTNKVKVNVVPDPAADDPVLHEADTFLFAPGFGADAGAANVHEVIDVSSSGFLTFQELLDSGALVQSGADVVLTFDPHDPAHSDRITLRGVDLSGLTSADFKF